jgi:hypothetical protein
MTKLKESRIIDQRDFRKICLLKIFVYFVLSFENTALRVNRFLPSPFPLPPPPKADQPQPNYPGLIRPSADSAEPGKGKKTLTASCLEKPPRPFRWERD